MKYGQLIVGLLQEQQLRIVRELLQQQAMDAPIFNEFD